ncbi:MAG: hypothetical protein JWR19_1482 [Pedosphaera sp.]|nr:hypothetical protein [Pedosphaera sp.]
MADLKIGKFYLQRNQGSNLILAVGKVENISNNVHFGVKVDLDILDVTGAKIGMVSDVIRELKPHAPWEFLATVSNLKAASVCFASIKEDR